MASKSRIHVNIARLREIESRKQEHLKGDDWQEPVLKIDDKSIMGYAGWYFDNYPEQCWNGRQIRNAFQIASSLAQYDMNKTSLDVWNDDKSNEGRSDRSAAYQILNWIQFDKVAEQMTLSIRALFTDRNINPRKQAGEGPQDQVVNQVPFIMILDPVHLGLQHRANNKLSIKSNVERI
ncbi:hypothetical protein G4B84_007768 [Aspergillus flavus NRRL3357]|nr:uncharacterized protein G4B84_007768 [Aspergillus flavus NRRL3357]QMW32337.1 hypothetical protein G4B84_007768 [Aspergillus flavus NRRL3357]